jgi:hypothetical protein
LVGCILPDIFNLSPVHSFPEKETVDVLPAINRRTFLPWASKSLSVFLASQAGRPFGGILSVKRSFVTFFSSIEKLLPRFTVLLTTVGMRLGKCAVIDGRGGCDVRTARSVDGRCSRIVVERRGRNDVSGSGTPVLRTDSYPLQVVYPKCSIDLFSGREVYVQPGNGRGLHRR